MIAGLQVVGNMHISHRDVFIKFNLQRKIGMAACLSIQGCGEVG